ncbi:MAG: preprotein translocase subunit SecA [Vampirovibrio sp.]|nr:preprotein translocase subunit SecA [Vampirovibrio sp.]
MLNWVNKILGDPNERKIKRLQGLVDEISDKEHEMQQLSDDDLRRKTDEFRQELDNREKSDDPKRDRQLEADVLEMLLPEAFAVVRETGKRVLGMRHFDTQMVGGIVLHRGGIAEMRTGEGKTLVATLPAYLNALSGKGVHIVTVNDYLARRDAEWMGKIYTSLGLTVGLVHTEQRGGMSFSEKKMAYGSDITYGTNNEFGFDYLRDNMAGAKSQLGQRPYNYAIIDEVDSILIDEARTPLIISGRLEQSAETYQSMARLAPQLKPEEDYTVDEKARNVVLTEEGIDRAQELLGVDDLFDPRTNFAHHLLQALKGKELFKKDIDYVVKNNEVVIVDEFTGRLMDGRRWSDGLHQAVEAKENVKIQDETQTLASITFQNLFRLYPKLSGMTGTALTEEAEFGKIYDLGVTAIPTNRADVRKDEADIIYKTGQVKFYKAAEEIVDYYQQGRPVLVGTVSIEKSEWISKLLSNPSEMTLHLREKAARLQQRIHTDETLNQKLAPYLKNPEKYSKAEFEKLAEEVSDGEVAESLWGMGQTANAIEAIRKGLPHHVLNAKHHEKEASIVAQAGRAGAITIATNMAGRGTDILLGGNPDFLAREEFAGRGIDWHEVPSAEYERLLNEKKTITDAEKEQVIAAGGLHIIGTERHESRRIDNQLRGRAARQGDPGSTRFYLSLEDNLMRLFGGNIVSGLMDKLNIDETMPITAGMVTGAIEGAQRKVEAYHFDIRKNILQYDDVLTEQRKLIYDQRRRVLEGENLRTHVMRMIEEEMARIVNIHIHPEEQPEDITEETLQEVLNALHAKAPQLAEKVTMQDVQGKQAGVLADEFRALGLEVYGQMEGNINQVAKDLEEQHGLKMMGLEEEEEAGLSDKLSEEELAERRHPLRRIERDIMLSIVDSKWIDHLHNLDSLREGIGLRAYGQKDPLIEYKREAYEMFQGMTYEIQKETVSLLFRARIEIQLERQMEENVAGEEVMDTPFTEAMESATTNSPEADSSSEQPTEKLTLKKKRPGKTNRV